MFAKLAKILKKKEVYSAHDIIIFKSRYSAHSTIAEFNFEISSLSHEEIHKNEYVTRRRKV